MNQFETAHYFGRGTITPKQLTALDSLLTQLGREAFNSFRLQVGIQPNTPNRRLDSRRAWRLLNLLKQQEVRQ